jgi:hypothetical protein
MAKSLPKWNEERTEQLVELAGEGLVSQGAVAQIAETMQTSGRSISSKLRKMGYEVELASAAAKAKSFSDEQEAALAEFVTSNSGAYTYGEIAENFGQGFSAKQVQGKILSMELTGHVKPTPKPETTKSYTDEEEAIFIDKANSGAFLEEIAEVLGRELNSVRGKGLSLMRAKLIEAIPKQRDVKGSDKVDAFNDLGDVSEMTVEEIATALGKSVRGVKTMLTRRAVTCTNYDGAAKAAKKADNAE